MTLTRSTVSTIVTQGAIVLLLIGGSTGTAKAQQCGDKPCWEVNLLWSMRDTGPVEKVIQEQWQVIDQHWSGTNLMGSCTTRACAMRKAVDAAKSGFCDKAFQIARSCQLHNPSAAATYGVGVDTICEWLKKH